MLQIKKLTKIYKGGKKAVSDLNLTVEAGDIYGFIGHNGAGKTTTIKCIVGIHDFDEGEILVDHMSVKANPLQCKSVMAYIPDNPDLYEYLTGIQYLNFIADIYHVSAEEREKRIREEADAFEITAALGDLISSYSHGMKQKLAIISALVHEPKLLILDEATGNFDPEFREKFWKILKEFISDGKRSVILATHFSQCISSTLITVILYASYSNSFIFSLIDFSAFTILSFLFYSIFPRSHLPSFHVGD